MKRAAVMTLVLAVMALAFAPLIRKPPEDKRRFQTDEVLMFAIRPGKPVTLTVPAGSAAVDLTVLARVKPQEVYDPGSRYRFAVNATLYDAARQKRQHWEIHLASRVSLDSFPPTRRSQFGAKVQDPKQWVTDSRVASLALGELAAAEGMLLTLEPQTGPCPRLLLVGFARRDPTLVPTGVLERNVDALARRKVGPVRAALGFDDLPANALQTAIGANRVRLDAVGRRKYDYELIRVTLSQYRRRLQAPGAASSRPHALETSSTRWLAFATSGSATLNLVGPAGTVVHVIDGIHARHSPHFKLLLRDDGVFEGLVLPDSPPRTVAMYTDKPASISVYTDEPGARTQLGSRERVEAEGGVHWLSPDIRRGKWRPLDPEQALAFRLEPTQQRLQVLLRARAQGEFPSRPWPLLAHYEIDTHMGTAGGEISGQRKLSRYDYWEQGRPSTHALVSELALPPGSTGLKLWGDSDIRARVNAPVPGGSGHVLEEPYRVELGSGLRWRYAPRVSSDAIRINPIDANSLTDIQRERTLTLQARIVAGMGEEREPPPPPTRRRRRSARQITPVGTPLMQRILVPQRLAGGAAFPAYAWTEIREAREVVVPRSRQQAARVTFRVSEEALGQVVRVLDDGVEVARQRSNTTWQNLSVPLEPGEHLLSVQGVGEEGTAFVDLGPVTEGEIIRRRAAYELSRSSSLTYRFYANKGRRLTLILQVYTEQTSGSWAAKYRVFANRRQTKQDGFRTEVAAEGLIGRRTRTGRRIWFRDLGPKRLAGWSESRIELQKTTKPGLRTVQLWSTGEIERVWVRAILLGSGSGGLEDRIRVRFKRRL